MPGLDGTGPLGTGPFRGGGFGRGFSRGSSRGLGRGLGICQINRYLPRENDSLTDAIEFLKKRTVELESLLSKNDEKEDN